MRPEHGSATGPDRGGRLPATDVVALLGAINAVRPTVTMGIETDRCPPGTGPDRGYQVQANPLRVARYRGHSPWVA
jgi:hypothetical protein